jgi:hypothetical protein
MIIHHPAIYFPLLLVAEPEEKDGLVPPLGSVPATTSKETCKSGAKTCSLPRLRARTLIRVIFECVCMCGDH